MQLIKLLLRQAYLHFSTDCLPGQLGVLSAQYSSREAITMLWSALKSTGRVLLVTEHW